MFSVSNSIKSPTYTTICVMPLCQRKRLKFCKSRITSKISVFILYIKIQTQIKSWLEQWHEIGTWSNLWVVLGTLASSSATTSFPFPCFFPSFILSFYNTQLKTIKIFTRINQLLNNPIENKGKKKTPPLPQRCTHWDQNHIFHAKLSCLQLSNHFQILHK